MRRRHGEVVDRAAARPRPREQRRAARAQRQRGGVEVHLQRADAGREVDDAGQRRALAAHSSARARAGAARGRAPSGRTRPAGCRRRCGGRSPRRVVAARRAGEHAGVGVRRRARDAAPARRAGSPARRAIAPARRAASARHGHEAHACRPARSWPSFHRSRRDDGRRADEAAEARAVGAEDDRHVAGEVDRADGVGVVVDVRRVQAGLAAVGARPLRLRARPAARRCGSSCSAPPSRWRRASSMSSRVKNSGAACGPSSTPISQSVAERGRSSAARRRRLAAGAGVAAPRCSTSPARSARPPWPPKPPSVKVDRAAEVRAARRGRRAPRGRRAAPGPSTAPTSSTCAGRHRRPAATAAPASPSSVAGAAAPVTQTVGRRVEAQRRAGRGDLQARRALGVAERRGCRGGTSRSSIGPDGGTPTCQ